MTATAGEVYAFPLTVAQRRFWVLNQLDPTSSTFNVPARFELSGDLDAALLERALGVVVERHEVLRTTFRELDGEPMQIVAPFVPPRITIEDRTGVDGDRRTQEVERASADEALTPFDLGKGPLIRCRLVRFGSRDHMLYLTMHHVVFDGWSLGILTRELTMAYDALARSAEPDLPELPIQYADFAVWQRDQLAAGAYDVHLQYWRDELAGLTPLDLPTDKPRLEKHEVGGAIVSRLLPRDLTDALTALSLKHESTLFTVTLAALSAFLFRLTGQDDVAIASPIANRNNVDVEGLIGVFNNILVLRTSLEGDPTFVELLRDARKTMLDGVAHQEAPFELVLEALPRRRGAHQAPILPVNLIFQRSFMQPLEFASLRLTPVPSRSPGAAHDLNFFMVERGEGWRLSCEYNADLYDGATIEAMLAQIERFLKAAEDDPHRRISQVPLLSDEEAKRLVALGAGPRPEQALDANEAVARAVAKSGTKAAILGDTAPLSFDDLAALVDRGAGAIAALGDATGPIGLRMRRGEACAVAALAVWKAGRDALFLRADEPASRTEAALDLAACRVLVADVDSPDVPGSVMTLRWPPAAAGPAPAAVSAGGRALFAADDPDGRPKILSWSRESVGIAVWNSWRGINLDGPDRAACSWGCGAGPIAALGVLARGGTLLVGDPTLRGDERAAALVAAGATALRLDAAELEQLLDGRTDLSALQTIVATHFIAPAGAARLASRAPHARVRVSLGAPECAGDFAEGALSVGPAPPGLGAAGPGFQLTVEDATSRLAAPGARGTLVVGGPTDASTGGRWRSAESCRYRCDGAIEWLGSKGRRARVGGRVVEPALIEALLRELPAVADARVQSLPGPKGATLVAYLVAREGQTVAPRDGRKALRGRVADAAVPSVFVTVPGLPRGRDGAIADAELPTPDDVRLEDRRSPPVTPSQVRVAEIWRRVLRVEDVSLGDNFFDLGGHSLMAVAAIVEIEKATGRRFSPRDFVFRTLEQIASSCEVAPAGG